jgi:hypothetical protein
MLSPIPAEKSSIELDNAKAMFPTFDTTISLSQTQLLMSTVLQTASLVSASSNR